MQKARPATNANLHCITLLIYSKHKKRDIQFSIKKIGRKLLIDIKHLFGYQMLLFVGYILLTIPLAINLLFESSPYLKKILDNSSKE